MNAVLNTRTDRYGGVVFDSYAQFNAQVVFDAVWVGLTALAFLALGIIILLAGAIVVSAKVDKLGSSID